ncbi:MAG: T9SS type A sorting domain-containing protein, partial [Chitinophagaceae bacterium]
ISIAGISDYKNHELSLINAGGNKLFATTLSTSSVELPSLATGVYFIQIKDKISGEATNLRYIKM